MAVRLQPHGLHLRLNGVPSADQGNTPFCGIHTLAMTAQYVGLDISADELAAAAQFKNTGSARGSRVLDLYRENSFLPKYFVLRNKIRKKNN